jgi:O-methyltransferase
MQAVSALVARYPIISDQIKRPALEVVLGQLEKILEAGVAGDIVEFGCYIGTTSLFIRRLLDIYEQSGTEPSDTRQFHTYDSFEGLPPKKPQDASAAGVDFKAGELSVSKKQLVAEFQKAHLKTPVIHKGWFGQLADSEVPDKIAFAFLDGDFYESMIDSLRLVWPRMAEGGVICLDDYQRETLPGVERAVRDFFQSKPQTVKVSHNIGVIIKS